MLLCLQVAAVGAAVSRSDAASVIPPWEGMVLCAAASSGPSPARGCEPVLVTGLVRDSGNAIIKVGVVPHLCVLNPTLCHR